jgi:outer membrane protein, multidrug efflux system
VKAALTLALTLSIAAAAAPVDRQLQDGLAEAAPAWSGSDGSTAAEAEAWWSRIDDPALGRLMDEALASSPTVQASWERLTVARSLSAQTGSVLLPSGALSAGWTSNSTEPLVQQVLNNVSGASPLPEDELRRQIQDRFGDAYQNGSWRLTGTWNVDLFGTGTTAWLATRWDARASEGSRAAQALALAANIGAAWYDVVAARERLDFVLYQFRVSRELTELVQLRYEGGQATALDLLQQRQQLANIEATLPAARAAVDRMVFRVAALVGRNPAGATVAGLSAPDRLPAPPEALALGRPVDLLNRRPDLILSQSSLQAAELRRTSAWLGLAPSLQLSGYTGDQGQLLGADATEWDWVGNWQVGLNASLPFFNGGRKLAAARGAAAGARASRFDLEQSTLNAVQEVEDSRRVLQQRNEELAARSAQVQAARLAFDESKAQYLGGTLPYVNVMTALSAAQSAELAHIQSRRDLVGAWITLQNALGAPWALDLDRPRGGATGGGR